MQEELRAALAKAKTHEAAEKKREEIERHRAFLAGLVRHHEDSVRLASLTQTCFRRFLHSSVLPWTKQSTFEGLTCRCVHDAVPVLSCKTKALPSYKGRDGYDYLVESAMNEGLKLVKDSVAISSVVMGCPLEVTKVYCRESDTEASGLIEVKPKV
jgi:hypothetical protein